MRAPFVPFTPTLGRNNKLHKLVFRGFRASFHDTDIVQIFHNSLEGADISSVGSGERESVEVHKLDDIGDLLSGRVKGPIIAFVKFASLLENLVTDGWLLKLIAVSEGHNPATAGSRFVPGWDDIWKTLQAGSSRDSWARRAAASQTVSRSQEMSPPRMECQ